MILQRILGAVAVILLFAAFPVVAQETVLTNEPDSTTDTAAPAAPESAWATRCASEGRQTALVCTLAQRVLSKASNQLVGSMTVQMAGDGKPQLIVSLPLGLSIPGGVTIDVDGAGTDSLALQTCDRSGCYASAPISDALLAALLKGTVLDVSFLTVTKQPVRLQFTLVGFDAAYKKIA